MLKQLQKKLYFKKLTYYLEHYSYIIVWWTDKKIPLMLDNIESNIKQDSLSISKVLWQKNAILFSLLLKNKDLIQKGSYFLTILQSKKLSLLSLILNQKINELFNKEKASFVGFLYTPEFLFLNDIRWNFLVKFYLAFKWFLTPEFFKLRLFLFLLTKFILKIRTALFLIFRNNVLFFKFC